MELDEAKRYVDDIGGVNAAEDEAKPEAGCDTTIRGLSEYTA